MADDIPTRSNPGDAGQNEPVRPIVIQQPRRSRWVTVLLLLVVMGSFLFFFAMVGSLFLGLPLSPFASRYAITDGPRETFESGSRTATEKIVILPVDGVLMPPFTERVLKAIEKAEKDDNVKGVVLEVDSPGGAVADSHQIYHKLKQLSEKKPIVVTMKRMAASGGYYVSMGAGPAGKIFAEPTTWTGSIGVILPRYEFTELANKLGVDYRPLTTGPYKASLSPFREMTEEERTIWTTILNDAYERFLTVIDENRKSLDYDSVKELATGQVYTAEQALEHDLIDAIGYREDAVEQLKKDLGLETVRVVRYEYPIALLDLLWGSAEARQGNAALKKVLETSVPRAYYYCSWLPGAPAP